MGFKTTFVIALLAMTSLSFVIGKNTTTAPPTAAPTTAAPLPPTTLAPTSLATTNLPTAAPTTPATLPPTTLPTAAPTTPATIPPTTLPPTTLPPTTQPPTTLPPTTLPPTTLPPTTLPPTTLPPTTLPPTTLPPTTAGPTLPPATLPPHPATVSFNVSGSGVNASVVLRLVIGLRVAINGSGGVKSFDLPASAAVSGGSKGGLTLTFDPDMVLGLTFSENDEVWNLSNLTLTYGKDAKTVKADAPNADGILSVHAHPGNAFKCEAEKELALGDDVKSTIVGLRVQPFMTGSENDFGKAELCEADKIPNNIVPIAVGAALAALVVIVLIMYLIGRRKHQRGYQTV